MALPAASLDRLVFGPLERIAAAIHADHPDIPVIGFPRGIGPEYARAAKLTGISGLSIDWALDPAWAAAHVQPHLTVQGNLDPRLVVAGGKPMRDAATHILETLGQAPFVFNLGHGFVPETPPEHVAELADLVLNWRRG